MAARGGASAQRPEGARQQLDLVFDNNRLASELYGEFDRGRELEAEIHQRLDDLS